MFRLAAPAQIVAAALGIGADHAEIARRREALVAGACRQHRHVAGFELEHLARPAAETHLGAPARHAECLVNHGVVVHVGKNAVAPHIAPAVCGKRALDRPFGVLCAGNIDGAAIDQKRQARIIRYRAVVAKHQGERFIRPV